MKPFDLYDAPLEGVHLIEAGAGTGKTYAIAGLFLRLIAEQGLSIDQILVVTYTKAATEELKRRIRQRLLSAKNVLTNEGAGDPLIASILKSGADPQHALQRIENALVDFDRAAIFTIHGFCQRVLHHFAFETGHLFEAELVQDAQPLIQETADDFWRRYIIRAPVEFVRYVLTQLKGPQDLAALFHQCRFAEVRVIPQALKPSLSAIRPWRHTAAHVVDLWPQARQEVIVLLSSEGLNAQKYGKCVPDKHKPGTTQRQIAITALVAAMDQWNGGYPLFDRFDHFAETYLVKATKKNRRTPEHPFFTLCDRALHCHDEMEQQMVDYFRYLKVRLLKEFHQRLAKKKAQENILFFDDLLLQVHHALQSGSHRQLAQAIQLQYQAVLVDEFQDTDSLQYEIFTRLFASGRALLFMIGDPKQAIYSFRGADLFSYLHAKDRAPNQYTLTRNWRATPALIQALNTIFGGHLRPFGYEKIPYEKAAAARADSESMLTPFQLWYLTRTDQDTLVRPMTQQEAVPRIVTAVAEEIVSLLSARKNGLAPEDIAVLTRTHRQAHLIKTALAQKRVPAVLHSAGRVFDSREAGQLSLVLNAVAVPADPRRVRSALSSDLLGVSAHELCLFAEEPSEQWQKRWAQFEEYHRIWLRHGFYRMFNHLMAEERVRPRLLAMPDGERRLTNVLHLAELLHQASSEHQLGPDGLIKWLTVQCREGGEGEDTQKLRLESDAHAVRIITIHKSKGLQFEVVFCPFTWAGAKVNDKAEVFHDPEDDDRLTLAIGPGIDPKHQRLALEEKLTENLRLMYVALTRARQCCYMAWGCIKGTRLSAPAYLLHAPNEINDQEDWMAPLERKMAAMTDAVMIKELNTLAQSADGTIVVEPLPAPSDAQFANPYDVSDNLSHREFKGVIDSSWRIASFSAMTAGLPPELGDWPDRDPILEENAAAIQIKDDEDHLFGFFKGARSGIFFHDLLEHWDFADPDVDQRMALVTDKLKAHGFEVQWCTAIDHMLERIGLAQLPTGSHSGSLRLKDVTWDQRVNEMEFYFPLHPVKTEQLKRIFQEKGGRLFSKMPAFHLNRWNFAPMQGFMKGYMDMVFTHEGKYYLLDWKSNHLGGAWADYDPIRLNAVMIEDYYFLQYHLYVVALDLLLRQRVTAYDYDRHFGGVYYLFLRGIQHPGAGTGIYYDVPDARLVEALHDLMVEKV